VCQAHARARIQEQTNEHIQTHTGTATQTQTYAHPPHARRHGNWHMVASADTHTRARARSPKCSYCFNLSSSLPMHSQTIQCICSSLRKVTQKKDMQFCSRYTCPVCDKEVTEIDYGVDCDECSRWFHLRCTYGKKRYYKGLHYIISHNILSLYTRTIMFVVIRSSTLQRLLVITLSQIYTCISTAVMDDNNWQQVLFFNWEHSSIDKLHWPLLCHFCIHCNYNNNIILQLLFRNMY